MGSEGGKRTRRGGGSDSQEADNQQEGNQQESNQEPELSPSPIIEALVPDPAQPPAETTVLQGLLGRSDKEGYWRVYLSSSLQEYAEFRAEDALYIEPIPKEESPLGAEGARVWLKQEAKMMYGYPGVGAAAVRPYGYPGFEAAAVRPYYGYPGLEAAAVRPYYGYPGFEAAAVRPYYGYPGFEAAAVRPYYGYPGFEAAAVRPYYGYPLV